MICEPHHKEKKVAEWPDFLEYVRKSKKNLDTKSAVVYIRAWGKLESSVTPFSGGADNRRYSQPADKTYSNCCRHAPRGSLEHQCILLTGVH